MKIGTTILLFNLLIPCPVASGTAGLKADELNEINIDFEIPCSLVCPFWKVLSLLR